jgi:hypothetical protein
MLLKLKEKLIRMTLDFFVTYNGQLKIKNKKSLAERTTYFVKAKVSAKL